MKRKSILILPILTVLCVLLAAGYHIISEASASPDAPEIRFDSEELLEVSILADDEALLAGVSAMDPEDGDVTASLVVQGISRLNSDSIATVTYAAFDSKNHVTKAQRQVRFTDYVAPRFALSDALLFSVSDRVSILNCVTAEDMVDGNLTDRIRFEMLDGSSTMDDVGTYSLQLRVTNSLGGSSVLPLTVEITASNPNPALITLSDYLIYLPQGASFDPADYIVSYRANGTTLYSQDGIYISSDVNTSINGVYTVTYTYESATAVSRTRLIVVVE